MSIDWSKKITVVDKFISAKEKKLQEIATARWNEVETPAQVEGYEAFFFTDKLSISDMVSASDDIKNAISMGIMTEEETVDWKTASGFIPLKLNDLVTIRLLLSQRRQALYTKEANIIRLINLTTNIEEVNQINWNMKLEE